MLLVILQMYQSTKPHTLPEISSITMTLAERSALQVEAIMELLEVCLRTTYFQVDDKFFQQKVGMAMGSFLSPTVSSIFMEHFEKLALDSVQHKQSLWLRYVGDTFVVWPHVCMYKGWVIKSSPCAATFNDLLWFGLASWSRAVTGFPQRPQYFKAFIQFTTEIVR
jgi:hypothetical protein